jgi:phosphocarrier protein HPr
MTRLAETTITVTNELGLHARPSAQLVETVSRFESEVYITRDDLTINAKSIMGVMMLAAEKGAVLHFRASGNDAEAAIKAIESIFADKFGED